MFLGIDAGSTYTKYVMVDKSKKILRTEKLRTPVDQVNHYRLLVDALREKFNINGIAACGYGRKNTHADVEFSELTSLARGVHFLYPDVRTVIDIGGQDTKVLVIKKGKLVDFVLNDKCAAGAGLYIKNALDILNIQFSELDRLLLDFECVKPMSTVCALYAQSEIIARIASGEKRERILIAAVDFVLQQVKQFVMRVKPTGKVFLTGGFSPFETIRRRLSRLIGQEVFIPGYSEFLSAYGSTLCF